MAETLADMVAAAADYGHATVGGGESVVVEWVSANPTGPLHLGHGRQAALGDAIATLLEWTGWSVHREFYYNDSGRQMELLARSVWARYQQTLGEEASIPEGGYQGAYVGDLARDLHAEMGDRFRGDDSPETLEAMRRFAVRQLRAEQDRDLSDFRVRFDEFYLESSLYSEGLVDEAIAALRETGFRTPQDQLQLTSGTR